MKRILSLAALAAVLLTAPAALAQPAATLDAGALQGVVRDGVEQFLGVPYANPPVGAMRWTAPAPMTPWTGVRAADQMADPCSAPPSGDGPRQVNEDCLYLNIYRPAGAQPGARLPVMVFLHGGAGLWGSPNIYNGARMAQVGQAVVVIPAFRIGVFGVLALPDQGAAGGAFTLQDQIAALQWVRANAEALGGNSADVTVLGESAGAGNVCDLLASPDGQGLYRQAIIQSSACGPRPLLSASQVRASELGAKLGCPPERLTACLRAADAARVLDAWQGPGGVSSQTQALPTDFSAALDQGGLNPAPVLVGFNRDERWPYQHGLYPLSLPGYQTKLKERYGARAEAVADRYRPTDFPRIEYALGAAESDAGIICQTFANAERMALRQTVSLYEFADRTVPPFKSLGPPQGRPPGYEPGAFHTAELQFLLGYQAAERLLDGAQRARGDAMIRLWVSFNRSGDWPTLPSGRMMRFDEQGAAAVPVKTVFDSHHCGFWNAPQG